MRRALLSLLLLSASAPVLAIYKCESGGKIVYSDTACPNHGKSSELHDTPHQSTAAEVTRAQQQLKQDKLKLKKLENARHKKEAQEEKQQQKIAKAAAVKQKKCASLAMKKQWSEEDATNATGKNRETAKRKARRMEEQYKLECRM